MLLIIIWYFFIIIFGPRPWPQPPQIGLGLGLGLVAVASASASRFWPRLTSLMASSIAAVYGSLMQRQLCRTRSTHVMALPCKVSSCLSGGQQCVR